MAQCFRFVCGHCSDTIEAWSDGNPYFLDAHGNKQYAYHPRAELALCIGNDSPHLCLECGEELKVDSRAPTDHCVSCASKNIVHLYALAGKRCPKCKLGIYAIDPDFFAIS
jgi:hypothetical protein